MKVFQKHVLFTDYFDQRKKNLEHVGNRLHGKFLVLVAQTAMVKGRLISILMISRDNLLLIFPILLLAGSTCTLSLTGNSLCDPLK